MCRLLFLQRPHSQSDTIRVLPMVRYAVFCGRPIARREQELVFGIGIKEGLWNLGFVRTHRYTSAAGM